MSEGRTQDALDRLADLFLTGPDACGTPSSGEPHAASPLGASSVDGMVNEEHPDNPSPVRLPPKIRPAATQDNTQQDLTQPPGETPPLSIIRGESSGDISQEASDASGDAPTRAGSSVSFDGPEVEGGRPGHGPTAMSGHSDGESASRHVSADAGHPHLRLRHGGGEMEDSAAARNGEALGMQGDATDGNGVREGNEPGGGSVNRHASDHAQPTPPSEDRTVQVEAVMLGNLPGVSGPWLRQYAHRSAESRQGAAAILHVSDEQIELELVEADEMELDLAAAEVRGLVDLLELLAKARVAPLRSVLVHHEAVTRRPGLSRLAALEDWTILCGADDAATTAARRMLEGLVEADASAAGRRVGLMVMGSDEATSRAGARRVQTTTRCLDQPVQFLGWQKQMEPVGVRRAGVFKDIDALWPKLQGWFEALGASQETQMHEVGDPWTAKTGQSVGSRVRRPRQGGEADSGAHGEAHGGAHGGGSVSAQAEAADRPRFVHRWTNPPPDAGAEAHQPHENGRACEEPPELVKLMSAGSSAGSVPGGIALEARCPRHPQTQLVLDQHGQLHLLRPHRVPAPHPPRNPATETDEQAEAGLRAAIVDLIEARRWVAENLQLIQLTQRQLRFDPDVQPMLHLFTDRADLATGLIARLGDTLKLHLLQQVRVGSSRTWFCTPLG